MNFTLAYAPEAEDHLAEAWLNAADPSSVTDSQYRIDELLIRDPKHAGDELAEGIWRLIVPPLVAYYEVDETRRIVTVTGFAVL